MITAVENLVDSYMKIYESMTTAAGHTTAQLNAAYAKILTTAD